MSYVLRLLGNLFNPNKSTEEIGKPNFHDEAGAVVKMTESKPVVTKPAPVPVVHMGGDPTVNGTRSYETEFTKESIINGIIKLEGGYTNNSKDLGGETNLGITYDVANKPTTKKRLVAMGWDGKMRSLTKPMAFAVYEIEYWNKLNLDTIFGISPFLADKLFDQAVNCGANRAGKWLQRALNAFNRGQKDYKDIGVDGGIGKDTLTALDGLIKKRSRAGAVTVLLQAIISMQGNHYITIGEDREDNEEFMYGWFMERLSHNVRLYFDKK